MLEVTTLLEITRNNNNNADYRPLLFPFGTISQLRTQFGTVQDGAEIIYADAICVADTGSDVVSRPSCWPNVSRVLGASRSVVYYYYSYGGRATSTASTRHLIVR